jgi:hypothetical protein
MIHVPVMNARNIMSPKLVITKSPIEKILGYKGLHSVTVSSQAERYRIDAIW